MPKYRSRATRCSDATSQLENAKSALENLAEQAGVISSAREADVKDTPEGPSEGELTEKGHEDLIGQLSSAEGEKNSGQEEYEGLAEEMRSWEENTAENFSQTEKYQTVSDSADAMESAKDTLEGIDWPDLPAADADAEAWEAFKEACDSAVEAIGEAVGEAENAEFPGMRG